VLRHLTLTCKAAITEKSAMMEEVEREESAKSSDRRPAAASDEIVDETVETPADVGDAELVSEADVIAEVEAGTEVEASKLEEEVN
jgi:hypothetical protein